MIDDIFEKALLHVLEMEGGFSDDPYDPGGPTNRGITLADFARFKHVTIDATSRARLVDDLKRIPDETVREIYRARYWLAGHCEAMPAPIAFFHFDACVNHGVWGAARMLQQAARVPVDGAIGPVTLGGLRIGSQWALIEAYADIRRARYRGLPHFWRFGRGWLKRVDIALTRAKEIARQVARDETRQGETNDNEKGTTAMEPIQYPESKPQSANGGGGAGAAANAKWWAQSRTVWGALITAAATVLPVLGPFLGIELSGEVIRLVGEQALNAVQALAGLIGTALTIYGRMNAAGPLVRKDVQVRV